MDLERIVGHTPTMMTSMFCSNRSERINIRVVTLSLCIGTDNKSPANSQLVTYYYYINMSVLCVCTGKLLLLCIQDVNLCFAMRLCQHTRNTIVGFVTHTQTKGHTAGLIGMLSCFLFYGYYGSKNRYSTADYTEVNDNVNRIGIACRVNT